MGKLASKIAAAALDVGGKLKADKRNQEQKYDYVSADKILSEGGQALFKQGVVVFPQVVDQEVATIERDGGKKRFDATVNFRFVVSDGEEQMELDWVGMGSDYLVPDKAMYKAFTSGHRYFVAKLLCIGEGNENGEHESEPAARKAQPTPQAVQQMAQATGAVVREVTPQNGNGDKPSAGLIARYNELREQALDLGLQADDIPFDGITATELTKWGKALKARIIEAEKAIDDSMI